MVRAHRPLDLIARVAKRALAVLATVAGLCLGLAAALPTSTASLEPHPAPAPDYDSALTLERAFARGDSVAAPGGASIILVHGHRTPITVVLFHGLTNSPRQFRRLDEILHAEGANVFVPRLPQNGLQGATAWTLGRLTAEQLRDVADVSVDIATGLGDTVIVVGLSAGGNVAAWTAQFRREVRRSVVIAPLLGLAHVSNSLTTPVINLGLRVPNYSKTEPAESTRPDRTPGWSTRAVGQTLRLGVSVSRAADNRAPLARDIRVLFNAHDHAVNRDAIDELALHWSAKGGHVAVYELADSLRLPHDVLDPSLPGVRTAVVDSVLLNLIAGREPKTTSVGRSRHADAGAKAEPVVGSDASGTLAVDQRTRPIGWVRGRMNPERSMGRG